ncbi:MAG: hypothetical protein BMS9Abin12_2261 [Acidimicrobiia bacterium]|nr:MAG: hypothetical protein BMS9Abin12_2261 [Acidimicrobiia bacterium]
MTLPQLPDDWDATRTTLQAYAHALTAIPRAAGTPDDRWTHVAMKIVPNGLKTAQTPLADGTNLVATIDLVGHEIVVEAGDDTERIDLRSGPAPADVGERVLKFAAVHGSTIDADRERFADTETKTYVPDHAEAFLSAAVFVAGAFSELNESVPGEVTGPHLWPHGFDIATEWFSPVSVPYGDSEASAQIAVGWYPAGDGYFYANPWPFQDAWGESPVLSGTSWHLEDWQGAVLDSAGVEHAKVVAFGNAVHALARDALSS